METKINCQSCGMPLENEEIKGTEQNGYKNGEYCKYCYENGTFKNPNMKLNEMKRNISTEMKRLKLPIYSIQKAVSILPALKRWKTK